MDNDSKFWLSTFGIIGVTIVVIVLTGLIYCNNRDARVERMVTEGADPIRASIALENLSLMKIERLLMAGVVEK